MNTAKGHSFPILTHSVVAVVATIISFTRSADASPLAAESPYAALVAEYEAAAGRLAKRGAEAAVSGTLPGEQRSLKDAVYDRLLDLADRAPEDAWHPLVWIVRNHPDSGQAEEAVDRLTSNHMKNQKFKYIYSILIKSGNSDTASAGTSEALARALSTSHPDPEVRPRALLTLGLILKRRSEIVAGSADPDDLRRASRRLSAEAEAVLGEVVSEYGETAFRGETISEAAGPALDELRRLTVGKPAPDIVGEDLSGKPLRLYDFRGRIVIVHFWAAWCGPCMEAIPAKRELVERFRGEPLIVLGVNGDAEREEAISAREASDMSWRSWWNEGATGGIASAWHVRAWPTYYVIDREGVIQFKFVGDPGPRVMESAISSLLNE